MLRGLVPALLTPSAVVSRSEELVSAPIGDELAMMDVDTGSYYMLDDIGTFVWEAISGPTRVADVLVRVREQYDVSAERCEADVLALLESLREKGLLSADG